MISDRSQNVFCCAIDVWYLAVLVVVAAVLVVCFSTTYASGCYMVLLMDDHTDLTNQSLQQSVITCSYMNTPALHSRTV
jgi:hypothetical protein